MVLSDLWQTSREALEEKHVQQIIGFAGEGKLLDGSSSSADFRQFLTLIPFSMMERYAVECITGKFDSSGLALQDIVNQIGERLGFNVEHGRYRGVQGQPGQDGLWLMEDGKAIVVEVKTTAAYTVNLETQVGYRKLLSETRQDVEQDTTSILLVVGRQETSSLEAQIRGSRHAWGIRVISVEALLRLLDLQEKLDDPEMFGKVTRILIPQEYTKVDAIIDLVFATAEESAADATMATAPEERDDGGQAVQKPKPAAFHEDCQKRIEKKLGFTLVRKSKSRYVSADGKTRLTLAVSKRHEKKSGTGFWYAFRPSQQEFLSEADSGFVAFGCGDADTVLVIPFEKFVTFLPKLNVTENEKQMWWHVKVEAGQDALAILTAKGNEEIDASDFLL
jgi:hypothetical protein